MQERGHFPSCPLHGLFPSLVVAAAGSFPVVAVLTQPHFPIFSLCFYLSWNDFSAGYRLCQQLLISFRLPCKGSIVLLFLPPLSCTAQWAAFSWNHSAFKCFPVRRDALQWAQGRGILFILISIIKGTSIPVLSQPCADDVVKRHWH